jgi:hypothetical protein
MFLALVKYKEPDASGLTFESYGFDVCLGETSARYLVGLPDYVPAVYVECKPTVGDDYPAILRQIKAAGPRYTCDGYHTKKLLEGIIRVLFLEEYLGNGVSIDDFAAFFENEGIAVVFLDEVLEALALKPTTPPA